MRNRNLTYAVVRFPGSNCDYDTFNTITNVLGDKADFLWHNQDKIANYDCIVLPGGFSYGDYLRCGAIARFSPIMEAVINYAEKGGIVIGICNGFQVLLESGLLPGALLKNKQHRFICKYVNLKCENNNTAFTKNIVDVNKPIKIPIAHFDGNYYADDDVYQELEKNNQIIFRYCDENGKVSEEANPNGSIGNVAGIINKKGNVLGMMPHPERATEKLLGSQDGKMIFESIRNFI